MAFVPLILMVASAAMSAKAQSDQGKAAKAQATYQSQIEENNAKVNLQNAEMAQSEANAEAAGIRNERDALLGQQAAALGASGTSIRGTGLSIQKASAYEAEKEAAMAKYRGGVQARNFGVAAGAGQAQAVGMRFAGQNAYRNAKTGAAATIVGGLASASGGYMNARSMGYGNFSMPKGK